MKRKLKLSKLNVESFVTSKEKNISGGSLPTDTNNPNVCVDYSGLQVCTIATQQLICSKIPNTTDSICFDSMGTNGCFQTKLRLFCTAPTSPFPC